MVSPYIPVELRRRIRAQDRSHSITGKTVSLFHPRLQDWPTHFEWSADGTEVLGKTEIGRVTVEVLQMNNPAIVAARQRWVSVGWHPPTTDRQLDSSN